MNDYPENPGGPFVPQAEECSHGYLIHDSRCPVCSVKDPAAKILNDEARLKAVDKAANPPYIVGKSKTDRVHEVYIELTANCPHGSRDTITCHPCMKLAEEVVWVDTALPSMDEPGFFDGLEEKYPAVDAALASMDEPEAFTGLKKFYQTEIDLVNHPPHYKSGGIESIDVIEAFDLNFNAGSAIKYILRHGRKDNALMDLRKAAWYIKREISRLEEQTNGTDDED